MRAYMYLINRDTEGLRPVWGDLDMSDRFVDITVDGLTIRVERKHIKQLETENETKTFKQAK